VVITEEEEEGKVTSLTFQGKPYSKVILSGIEP
jgi:hypothetical protein